MESTITDMCQYLRNYFVSMHHTGTFHIKDGRLYIPWLVGGSYFLISGSIFNDGVYRYPAYGLVDETFTGTVSEMALSPDFIQLAGEIAAWRAKYEAPAGPAMSPYASEVYGNYSYQKSGAVSWIAQYAARLNQYRKRP